MFLVRIHFAGQNVAPPCIVPLDPSAGGVCRFAGHVLSSGVSGRVIEAKMPRRPNSVLVNMFEFAGPCRRLRGRLDRGEILVDPNAEFPRLSGIVEDENLAALHLLLDDGGHDASAFRNEADAAIVAGDKRSFGGRERYKEFSFGVLALDAEGSCCADRRLRYANEVLNLSW
jgi:hypothetical protein